jgi:hypothetical protein
LAAAALAAVGVRPASADACPGPNDDFQFTCGSGRSASCCRRHDQCCALKGNAGTCCNRGQCVCTNGTCSGSNETNCPSGCFLCAPA